MPSKPPIQLPDNTQASAGVRALPQEAGILWEASIEHATRLIASALVRCGTQGEAPRAVSSATTAARGDHAIQLFVLPPSSDAYTSFCANLHEKSADASAFAKS